MGGSVVFILMYWWRRFSGRDWGRAKRGDAAGGLARSPSGTGGGGGLGSVKSFYSSDPTGSEVEIAIQPGSARYAGGQMVLPNSEGLSDGTYTPRSDASPSPVRRRRPESPTFRPQ